MKIIAFLNNNSGAFMVIITLIYVIATIAIWRANNKSAKATEKQLIESKRQFAESQRLQMLPSLQIVIDEELGPLDYDASLGFLIFSDDHIERCRQSCITLSLENAGLGTAKNLQYLWIDTEKNITWGDFPLSVLYQQDRVKYIISVGISDEKAKIGEIYKTQLAIYFKDLLDTQYKQTIYLHFEIRADKYPILHKMRIEKLEMP